MLLKCFQFHLFFFVLVALPNALTECNYSVPQKGYKVKFSIFCNCCRFFEINFISCDPIFNKESISHFRYFSIFETIPIFPWTIKTAYPWQDGGGLDISLHPSTVDVCILRGSTLQKAVTSKLSDFKLWEDVMSGCSIPSCPSPDRCTSCFFLISSPRTSAALH